MRSRVFQPSREVVVIAHNIRSILNVGAILRTAEGFGAQTVFATGWTPSPENGLLHVRAKIANGLHKTALGAEQLVDFHYESDIEKLLAELRKNGFRIVGLEQDERAVVLNDYRPHTKTALLLGEEVDGLAPDLRNQCDDLIEIPMFGRKESFNVSVAAGIALYNLTIRLH